MGAFSGLRAASRGFTSNAIRAGRYVGRIDACTFFDARSGEKWKTTMTILAVDDGGEKPHKVGEVVHIFHNCKAGTEGKEIFQRNVKSFIASILECDDDQVGEEEIETILGATKDDDGNEVPNPLAGLCTLVQVKMRASKKEGRDEEGKPYMYPIFGWSAALDEGEVRDLMDEEQFDRLFPNGFGA